MANAHPNDATLRPRSLINEDGGSFASEVATLEAVLAQLANDVRENYRDRNAADVAAHSAARILVVAGPGAGKSYLFLQRIKHWLESHSAAEIYVASFVRKLVLDLQGDIRGSLDASDRRRVAVTTLHQLARSLVERGRGTKAQPMRQHIRVIAPAWDDVVWDDVFQFEISLDPLQFRLEAFVAQFHSEQFSADAGWVALRAHYAKLCQFYNALGFADMISLARVAVEDDPTLAQHTFWIVDEYQDFNRAEDLLVRAVTASAEGVMLAGDDDQALYQVLKASHPEIIISYYDDAGFANAMLPYCGRCSYHICLAASAFMAQHRDSGAIDKVYLPLRVEQSAPRVRIVGTAAPSAAVEYIGKFLVAYKADLDVYVKRLEEGTETDPFLLILSPDRDAKFYKPGGADEALRSLVERWAEVSVGHGFDYRRVATYYGAAGDARDNFSLRKVLYYEDVLLEHVHRLVVEAMAQGCNLADLNDPSIHDAVAKCTELAHVVDAPELDVPEKIDQLKALVEISDPERFAREIAADPIGTGTTASEDELALALPTAGRLSAVELMSMAGSKGLSAQHVIIIGCDDVSLQKTSPLTFFVALTRARRSLHLITAMRARGKTAHPYVADLPSEHCEYRWYTKKDGTTKLKDLAALLAKFEWLAKLGKKSTSR